MAKASGKPANGADKKPRKSALIVTVAALTVLAAIGGGLMGKVIAGKLQAVPAAAAAAAEAAPKPSPYAGDTQLRELSPIVTNLAEPAETRVRLQVAIIYPKKAVEMPDVLAAQITDDIVAFLKTLRVSQLQGASGLQALREDLNDRVRTRSDGKVREVMIENLVVQ